MKQKIVPFTGAGTALITPFKDGAVDYPTLEKLIARQLDAGVKGLVVLGTTGEPPTLSDAEKRGIITTAVKLAEGKAAIIVGVGGNHTAYSASQCKIAQELGADAVLASTPYYNKTSRNGLVAHFAAIADASDLPVIMYNVPGRTGINLPVDVAEELAEHPRIAGIKEASSNIEQIVDLFAKLSDKLSIYCGSDDQNYIYLALGGEGVISVLTNLAPEPVARMIDLYNNGDVRKSREVSFKLNALAKGLFVETSPIPLKAAMAHIGLCKEEFRLPLVPLRDDLREKLFALIP
ncbi:MAG: 4-hydroxy-tetrahydrodipicolinate synthase [Oscillospiraceae bacterium]|jgi:4-hydroxy-tetrahydrodipicolinate synthase|nr:4-hydroxy-tetrahydrodipicolinate synthase [Oscillospiraceae bacterium]